MSIELKSLNHIYTKNYRDYIGWITDKPVNNPKIRTFSPESTDLQSAINVWLKQLADGM